MFVEQLIVIFACSKELLDVVTRPALNYFVEQMTDRKRTWTASDIVGE